MTLTPPSGFSFDNVHRNELIVEQAATSSAALPLARKTGTTIVGLIYASGVVLGADTRATSDSEIAEKQSDKIHYLAPNLYCCGAGTAADTEQTTRLIASQLELLRLELGQSQSRAVTAVTRLKRLLFRHQGHISAALILGGCDLDGPHVFQIYPHGSTAQLPYTSMGSGSLAAMATMEGAWQENMTEADAVALVQRAVRAGIFNDLGSGSQCDTCVLRMDGTMEFTRGRDELPFCLNDVRPLRNAIKHSPRLIMHPGTTPLISTSYTPHPITKKVVADDGDDDDVVEMET